jgi:hypothetical protein
MHRASRVLIRRIGLLALCLAVGGIAAAQLANQFKTRDGRLSFWAPVEPMSSVQHVPGRGRNTYQQTSYVMESPRYLFLASVLELGRGPPATGDEESFLAGVLDTVRAGMGEKFVLDTDGDTRIRYRGQGFPGRQITGSVGDQQMVVRTFVAAKRIYILQAGYLRADRKAAENARRFLDSVVIDDPENPS